MSATRQILALALRNARRNRGRTLITIATIVIGVFVITSLRGFIVATQSALRSSIARQQTGDLQISPSGYLDTAEIAPLNVLVNVPQVRTQLLADGAGINAVAPRVRYAGVMLGDSTTPFFSIGTDPRAELQVCPRLAQNVVRGRFLGRDSPYEIVITENLARSRRIDVGDEVVIMAITRDGAQNTMELQVVGVLASMMRSDRMLTYTNIRAARELLGLHAAEASQIVVRLEDGRDVGRAKEMLAGRARQAKLPVDVTSWTDVMAFFKRVMGIQTVFNVVISVILFLLVSSVVINTVLMSVFERTREIGTMRALGMRASQVRQLFVVEGLYMGLAGGLVGTGLATVATLVIRARGGIVYDLVEKFGESKPWVLLPAVTLQFAVVMWAYGALCGIVAAQYPARKAAALAPVDALAER